MVNPFAPFEPRFLDMFIKRGVIAFVLQTYDRGRNLLEENPRPAFLVIHFDDAGHALHHYDAIKHDAGRRLWHISNADELADLTQWINNPAHRLYTQLTMPGSAQKVKQSLDKRLHHYIDTKTNWHPSRADEIQFDLEITFGEIYVRLKYGPRQLQVPLSEIENQKHVL